jgi:hypothetical protein
MSEYHPIKGFATSNGYYKQYAVAGETLEDGDYLLVAFPDGTEEVVKCEVTTTHGTGRDASSWDRVQLVVEYRGAKALIHDHSQITAQYLGPMVSDDT